MKKFIGNVNGVEYTNREDFNKAVDEAVKKNDGQLSISSRYEEYVDDVCDDTKQIEEKFNVNASGLIFEAEKTEVDGKIKYQHTSEIEDILKTKCANPSNVYDFLNYEIHRLENRCDSLNREIENFTKDYENENAKKDYYTQLKSYLNEDDVKKDREKQSAIRECTPRNSASFIDFLFDTGFWRF